MAPALVVHPWVRTPLAVGMAVLLAGVLAYAAARLWPVQSTVTNGADLSPQTIVIPGWVIPNSGAITWTIP